MKWSLHVWVCIRMYVDGCSRFTNKTSLHMESNSRAWFFFSVCLICLAELIFTLCFLVALSRLQFNGFQWQCNIYMIMDLYFHSTWMCVLVWHKRLHQTYYILINMVHICFWLQATGIYQPFVHLVMHVWVWEMAFLHHTFSFCTEGDLWLRAALWGTTGSQRLGNKSEQVTPH